MNSILLVEDTSALAEQVADLLRMEGYNVTVAENGLAALSKLTGSMPDLLITDLLMPEMDGFELIRYIRGERELQHLPVIVLTAKSDEEFGVKLNGLHVSKLLRKPCEADDLINTVSGVMNSHSVTRDSPKTMSC
jgi:Response regulators consisting of a CheY-like receiver domain and a winged-helix DNA-binding domain